VPIKKDATGKRWVEMEVLLPGTPEQVWQAIATGAGNAAWFVKGEVEPRVGGKFGFDFGQGAVTSGEVTTWEPPHKFGYVEREWAPGAPPVATEITIIGRTGERCVMRMVHSLFTSSDAWDDQIEGFEKGWPGFFVVLRLYLTHFAGKNAASFMAMLQVNADASSTWHRLVDALGMAAANAGDSLTKASGPEDWTGAIEHVYQDNQMRYVLARITEPTAGAVLVGTLASAVNPSDAASKGADGVVTTVSVNRYFYGANADALVSESELRWREWLEQSIKGSDSLIPIK
jgi:uncharacterized protein YndB with AHSA1/START domain